MSRSQQVTFGENIVHPYMCHLQKKNHVRLNLSSRLISHGTMFFSHNKTASVGLSAAETISRIGHEYTTTTILTKAGVLALPRRLFCPPRC
jgi:hypothetical protein